MSSSQGGVIKWMGGIAATIISGVIVWHLTEGTNPPENPLSSHESPAIKSPVQEQSLQPLPTPQMSPSSIPERWKLIGVSTKTGEEVYVDNSSIDKASGTIRFTYKIGNDLITASADCNTNRWYAKNKNTGVDYGWTSPQSQTTQIMMNYVCKS